MAHPWPKQVKIVEVGPRDGLQAEEATLPIDTRVRFIDALTQAGLPSIEVGSLVSPRWIPQLESSDQVYERIQRKGRTEYSLLVPNREGFVRARALDVKSIAVFTAASETFCQKNMNCSLAESYSRFAEFLPDARAAGMFIRGYVSCIAGCPYEGAVTPENVTHVVDTLFRLGCHEVSLGDTIGVGTPGQILPLLEQLTAPRDNLAVHFHNTYGQALANILVALEKGITTVDAAASGLGGCPYAPGASGNVATEDVVYMLHGMGIETGVDMARLLKASEEINHALGRKQGSAYGQVTASQ